MTDRLQHPCRLIHAIGGLRIVRLLTIIFFYLYPILPVFAQAEAMPADTEQTSATSDFGEKWVKVTKEVRITGYFQYVDSLVNAWATLVPYSLSEHLLVQANPWIIERLAKTDYYRMMALDSFVYDQRRLRLLNRGDSLQIPGSEKAARLMKNLQHTYLDINIPEFTLRIYQDSLLLYSFPVRVGQNRSRYLKTAGRIMDLRTKTGQGIIVAHNRFPDFYNPVDGKRFYLTKRDDGRTTVMPQIPWMDTSINGIRHGQMIHPTTNPETLGRAYSNGCVGLGEAASWIVYYHAPAGTRIHIRYDLRITDSNGREQRVPDIYGYEN